MRLNTGSRLGPYEVTGTLGAGGMGEVFRGHEAGLNRDVAIKVLPAAMASDPERLARFRREAQMLASLNHPNIAHVYGFEAATLEGGEAVHFLAMELVEGDDLSVRLAHGALPLDEALNIARQVAEALEEAHEHGIIHRDLKPANIKVTREGKVKVLDFGLAKAYEGDGTSSGVDISHSPTMSRHMTEAGIILGTAAYMSPEQARGKSVDRRADVWSFGVVLFEMLTGTRLFSGETTSDVLARVLMADPDWNLLPATTPEPIRKLLRRCLARDPRVRLRDIGEARIGLEEYQANPAASVMMSGASVSTPARPGGRRSWVGAIALAVVAATGAWLFKPAPAPVVALRRFAIPAEKMVGRAVISPDGRRVIYVADSKLWVREIDRLEPRVLAPVPAFALFWSPDSQSVAYVFDDKVWRVAAAGGNPSPIAPLTFGLGGAAGGTWTIDDRILFSSSSTGLGIHEVPADGGAFREVVKVDPATDGDFHQPSLLPDGKSFLFVADLKTEGPRRLEVFSNGKRKVLLNEAKGEYIRNPTYSPTGHILYGRRLPPAGVWAVRFDPARLEVQGEPFLVAADVGLPSVANDGTLVVRPAAGTSVRQLAWLDNEGRVLSKVGEPVNGGRSPRLSPDGKKVAFTAEAGLNTREVYVMTLPDGVPTRLTFTPENEDDVEWLPPGQKVLFSATSSAAASQSTLYVKAADGTGSAEIIGAGSQPSASPDGKSVVVGLDNELWTLDLGGHGKPARFLAVPNKLALQPAVSPDGRFVAYTSTETGDPQIYVRPYPTGDAKWQISTDRGMLPRWNRRGDRLYFLDASSTLWMVEIETHPGLSWKAPRKLFTSSPLDRTWDFSPDGRILAYVPVESGKGEAIPTMIVTENWFAEFREKKKPAGGTP
jgi:Tol biopolymer transport system component